ncbi:MAG: hypothetical protein ABIJ34_02990 [archaeon]
MINISFNSEMDSYMSRRRQENRTVETQEVKKPKSLLSKVSGRFSEGDDNMEKNNDAAVENDVKPKGLLSRIKNWLSFDDDEDNDDTASEQTQKTLPDDLLEALKIQNKWLKQLPSPVIREFKGSDDFKRYKEILDKYGVLKK